MKLVVTGASSFVGAWFCTLAVRQGHEVWGVWRNTPLRVGGVRHLHGDVAEVRPPAGADAVIHLATKVMADDAHAQNTRMLDAVLGWGLPVVYCSSTVVHWPRENAYQRSRKEDEARVRDTARWLIVRPCAPYGPVHPQHHPARRESFHTLAGLCRFPGFIPVIGDGSYRRQPVHVDDFNGAILALLQKGRWNGAYDAGGPAPLAYRDLVRALGGRPVPLPRRAVELAGRVAGFHPDVLATFDTDDVVDPRPLALASGVEPRPFDPASLGEFRSLSNGVGGR